MHASMATFFIICYSYTKRVSAAGIDQVSPQISTGKTDLFVYRQYLYKI